MNETQHLNRPHGGTLVSCIADSERRRELQSASKDWLSWDLTPRQICDLELLTNGGFSPLQGFMRQSDYESVCSSMRLQNGLLWPMPITLDVPQHLAKQLKAGTPLALRDAEGVMLAVLHVEEIWQTNLEQEAEQVFGTTDRTHPGAAHVLERTNPFYISGKLEGVQFPAHYDYRELRLTPAEIRAEFARLGWRRIVAFQTRNPMHRAHVELTFRAAKEASANLLIQPAVGVTKLGDVDYFTRVRCY